MSADPHREAVSPAARARIAAALDALAAQEDVRFVFAIESGSRGWGFPSPDSDYDVRFVYVRRPDWYLSVRPGRDVIETPITADLDIGGWDLQKALSLLLKPNPAVVEWLTSPIRYRWNEDLAAALASFAKEAAFGAPLRAHYIAYTKTHRERHIEGKDRVVLKKYFYVVRPALCLRWLRCRPAELPPMNIFALMDGLDLAPALRSEIESLIARKSDLAESGEIARIPLLERFISEEVEAAGNLAPTPRPPSRLGAANTLFRQCVHGIWAGV